MKNLKILLLFCTLLYQPCNIKATNPVPLSWEEAAHIDSDIKNKTTKWQKLKAFAVKMKIKINNLTKTDLILSSIVLGAGAILFILGWFINVWILVILGLLLTILGLIINSSPQYPSEELTQEEEGKIRRWKKLNFRIFLALSLLNGPLLFLWAIIELLRGQM